MHGEQVCNTDQPGCMASSTLPLLAGGGRATSRAAEYRSTGLFIRLVGRLHGCTSRMLSLPFRFMSRIQYTMDHSQQVSEHYTGPLSDPQRGFCFPLISSCEDEAIIATLMYSVNRKIIFSEIFFLFLFI